MRTLAGKEAPQEEKPVKRFKKPYEGRYMNTAGCCSDRQEVWQLWKNGDNRK